MRWRRELKVEVPAHEHHRQVAIAGAAPPPGADTALRRRGLKILADLPIP